MDDTILKLRSFAHMELNRASYNDPSHIRHHIQHGIDLFDRENHDFTESLGGTCRTSFFAPSPNILTDFVLYFCLVAPPVKRESRICFWVLCLSADSALLTT